MFFFRESLEATSTGPLAGSRVEVAFTDSSLDLQGLRPAFAADLARLEGEIGVSSARLNQVHGAQIHEVTQVPPRGSLPAEAVPTADAQVTRSAEVALMVRVADCVPVVLADPAAGVIGVAHAGRVGTQLDIVTRTVDAMRAIGAEHITGWVGPHVCGRCYEVPAEMRDEVASLVPQTRAETSWGTPALDLGAGVTAQLAAAGVTVVQVSGCTREEPRLHSHRRDGAASGRFAGLVWLGGSGPTEEES